MGVTSIKEIHSGRDGAEELGRDDQEVRRYTRVFRVTTGSNYDGWYVISGSPSLPVIGAVYPSDPEAYCRRRRGRNESFSKQVWIVTCAYSTEKELEENPLNEPAEIEWDTEQFQRPYVKDKDGEGIVNSAGDAFDPAVDGDDSRWMATVQKNVAAVPTWLLEYRDAVNEDEVTKDNPEGTFEFDGLTIYPNEAKMQAIRISKWQERNDVNYRVLTMRIQFKYDERQHGVAEDDAVFKGWSRQTLDIGLRRKDPDDATKRIKCLDDEGREATSPMRLDGAGAQQADPTPANAKYITDDIYQRQPFAVLPLT